MSNNAIDHLEGFILAGGGSRRMGEPKYKLMIGGKTFIERAAESLETVTNGNMAIVGEIEDEYVVMPPVTRVSDRLRRVPDANLEHDPGGENRAVRGSLVGLYTALKVATSDWIAVLACDLPFANRDLIADLAGYRSDQFDAIVPIQPDGRSQPLCAFYRRETCLPAVEAQIAAGNLKVQQLAARVKTRFVEFNEIAELVGSAYFFLNVNTPEDHDRTVEIAESLRLAAENVRPVHP